MDGAIWFYLIAALAAAVSILLCYLHHEVDVVEAVVAVVASFLISALCHWISFLSLTHATETYSGEIIQIEHIPAWVEYWEEAIYKTEYYNASESYRDSNGNLKSRTVRRSRQVFSHYEPRKTKHRDEYQAFSNIDKSYGISVQQYVTFRKWMHSEEKKSRGKRKTGKHASRMISGDPFDYHVNVCAQSEIIPVHKEESYRNIVKASEDTLYAGVKLTEEEENALPDKPRVRNPFRSDRVVGTNDVSILAWDRMCSIAGYRYHANPILVKLASKDDVNKLYSKWRGGDRNDIVICYNDGWCSVFDWCEDSTCRNMITQMVMTKGISDELLPELLSYIGDYYKEPVWEELNYLSIRPKWYHIFITFILVLIANVVWHIFTIRESIFGTEHLTLKWGRK